ncbi:hypothetical protein DU002_17955 [Corallincola holothuriorum]|uniref:PEP-CTERM protein-sorting domain-containing protein n=1 Tax=Corallincola holothuriorum TaxID=2282215 RepID=A0A368N255_9GAMM|nr:hypothetical protein [Corallincola holothuriorum]RCU44637.1 hypothetical protein DU002_17955 [Corallincola holothuriorum]
MKTLLIIGSALLASVVSPSIYATPIQFDLVWNGTVYEDNGSGDYVTINPDLAPKEFQLAATVSQPTNSWLDMFSYDYPDREQTVFRAKSIYDVTLEYSNVFPLEEYLKGSVDSTELLTDGQSSVLQHSQFEDFWSPDIQDVGRDFVNLFSHQVWSKTETNADGHEQDTSLQYWVAAEIHMQDIFGADEVRQYSEEETWHFLANLDKTQVTVYEGIQYYTGQWVGQEFEWLDHFSRYARYEGGASTFDVDAPHTMFLSMLGLLGIAAYRRKN